MTFVFISIFLNSIRSLQLPMNLVEILKIFLQHSHINRWEWPSCERKNGDVRNQQLFHLSPLGITPLTNENVFHF